MCNVYKVLDVGSSTYSNSSTNDSIENTDPVFVWDPRHFRYPAIPWFALHAPTNGLHHMSGSP